MSRLSIGEVAQRSGLATSTIRYYESFGLLPIPQRLNGRRRYSEDVIQHLIVIRAAQNASYSLAEIRELFLGFPDHAIVADRWKEKTPQKMIALDAMIEQAKKSKRLLETSLECDCTDFETCTLTT